MPNYMIAYRGGNQPGTPEEGAAHMAKWKVWLEELGDAVVNPGTPLGKTSFLTADGIQDDAKTEKMSGFSVVSTESIEAAIEIAQKCPFLDIGGTLEVSEMMEMKSG